MKVAILSDTHGYLDARIASDVAQCDVVVHGGDVGSAEVLKALRPRLGLVVAVRGNNDTPAKWTIHEVHTLACLPLEARLALPGGHLVVVHGDRAGAPRLRHKRLRQTYRDARAVVYGHSHQLICDQSEEPWILNPGAAGKARIWGGPSYLILVAQTLRWTVEIRRYEPLSSGRKAWL
jgi:phosphoesterase, MJ0936 family